MKAVSLLLLFAGENFFIRRVFLASFFLVLIVAKTAIVFSLAISVS